MAKRKAATTPVASTDPVEFTRQRLVEIAEVWVKFLEQRVQTYRDLAAKRLPDALRRFLARKGEPPAAAAETGPA